MLNEWTMIFGGLFLFSLSFALIGQSALNHFRKWLLTPTVFIESLENLVRSARSARVAKMKDPVVDFLKVCTCITITSMFIIMVFLFSAIGFSSLISVLAGSSFVASVNLGFIEGAVIVGALVAIMTRVFSTQISDALIKAVFFQGTTAIAAYVLVFFLQPTMFYETHLGPTMALALELWTNGYLMNIFIVFGVVYISIELLSFARAPSISLGLFRERRESLETGTQCLLKDQIESTVKAVVGSCERIKTMRWATGGGFEDLEPIIFEKCDQDTVIKFITSQATLDNWRANRLANRMIPYTRISADVGYVRFMIINDKVLIEVLPMPDSNFSNTGIVIRHPLVVQERILAFDNWYDSLQT
jgi:hypothetical protein